ncbi:MAG: 6-bladed beta-propeller [Proteobacteria bacterium]|nr:6-bladed beta-propeller [Pseudomonadota bacterium]
MNTKRLFGAVVAGLALLVTGIAVAGSPATTQAPASRPPEYRVVHGWPVLPAGEVLGSVAGVGVDSHGEVFVFHRAGRTWPASDELDLAPIAAPTIDVFDGRSGALVTRWGANTFAMPHGLTIDDHGNVWLTDVALQQVYKYSHDGRLLLTIGERGVAGNDAGHFNRPTEVAVAPDGSFYVSDGYRNTRIMKFSAAGKFLFQWGTKGSGPGQFDLPHGVTLDAHGKVYVADRSNQRIQIFDASGHYLREWKDGRIGRPYAIAIDHDGHAFVADGGDQPKAPPDRSAWVEVAPDGSPLARIGRFGNYDGQFEMAHAIAVAADGAVYVGDITGARVQKFVRVGSSDEHATTTH